MSRSAWTPMSTALRSARAGGAPPGGWAPLSMSPSAPGSVVVPWSMVSRSTGWGIPRWATSRCDVIQTMTIPASADSMGIVSKDWPAARRSRGGRGSGEKALSGSDLATGRRDRGLLSRPDDPEPGVHPGSGASDSGRGRITSPRPDRPGQRESDRRVVRLPGARRARIRVRGSARAGRHVRFGRSIGPRRASLRSGYVVRVTLCRPRGCSGSRPLASVRW